MLEAGLAQTFPQLWKNLWKFLGFGRVAGSEGRTADDFRLFRAFCFTLLLTFAFEISGTGRGRRSVVLWQDQIFGLTCWDESAAR